MADKQILVIVRSLERLAERVVVKITLDATANFIESTPVLTGWARANWVPSIGASKVDDLKDVVPTSQLAASAGVLQQSAISSVAARYRLSMGRVFITNNVPYIEQLNDGSSRKEPAGFVQRGIAKAVTIDIGGLAP